ncbi:MAG TPA: hypothetical protein VHN80_07490 [Kineosporiaceae bacterium]|nr:hypothetical protein [Kineosporiaceae bacterium]
MGYLLACRGRVVVDLGLLEDQWVAGRDRLELGKADHVVDEVLDLPDVKASAHQLVDKPGFALDGLPAVAVEGALDDVAVDPNGRVLVASTSRFTAILPGTG